MINYFVMIVFTMAVIGNLLAEINANRNTVRITKPFIIPLLLAFYIMNSDAPEPYIIAALLCYLGADIAMLGANKRAYFGVALLATFTAQLMYMLYIIFKQEIAWTQTNLIFMGTILYVFFGTVIIVRLFSSLKSLKIPVLLGIITILGLSYLCLLRMPAYPDMLGWMPLAGSVLLVLAFFLMIFHHFKAEIKNGQVYYTAANIFGQVMMICGFLLS